MYEPSWEILFIIDTSLFRRVSSTSFSYNGHPLPSPPFLTAVAGFPIYWGEGNFHAFLAQREYTDRWLYTRRCLSPHEKLRTTATTTTTDPAVPLLLLFFNNPFPLFFFLPFHFRLFPSLALFGENNSLPPAKKGKHRIIKLRVDVTSRVRRKRKQIWWNFRAKRIWRILTNVTWNEEM